MAQAPQRSQTSGINGTVADPSGAVIPGATIHVERHRASGQPVPNSTADALGNYSVSLAPGIYDVTITASGFSPFVSTVTVSQASTGVHVNATLNIATEAEQVTVSADQNSTSASENKSAMVFGATELRTFSDDDATFQQQIQAIAGADPTSGSSLYVDGFSGGQMPPKNAIREIRINQNPYSAQFQDLGFGRIEVFTKPGASKLHGGLMAYSNYSAFNAQNPFSTAQPAYYMLTTRANVSGPIGKKTSFFTNLSYNNQGNNSVINAILPGMSLGTTLPFNSVISSPTVSFDGSIRLDRQVTANNVLTGRYEITRYSLTNGGLAGSVTPYNGNGPPPSAISSQILPSEANNTTSTNQSLQLSDSQNIGKNKVLETRFQWIRSRNSQTPISNAPTLNVNGYFNGGGSPSQTLNDHTDRTEFQEYFSLEHGAHFFRVGGRYRGIRDANLNTAGYNGTFTYSSSLNSNTTALDNYQANAPTQLILTTGSPSATVYTGDLSIYADDEWHVKKSFTLNFGFRAESQSAIPDHWDPAPRVGASWAIGQTDKRQPFVTLRTGVGLFYDRFPATSILTAVRQGTGTVQQQYVFTLSGTQSADCIAHPTPACGSGAQASQPTPYRIAPDLHSQYSVVTGLTAERGFGKYGNISVNYIHTQGSHFWVSRNINAPFRGTYTFGVPTSGVRPLGGTQNIYQFSSNGSAEQNFVFGNAQINVSSKIHYWAWFGQRYRKGDTQGSTSFPTNQYNVHADYGRASQSVSRLFTGASVELPWGITANPFIAFTSRQPFNITVGSDLNGDAQYNDRPSFATSQSPATSVYKTPYGTFNASPVAGETIIPINYGNGPRYVYTELGMRKSFKFGTPQAPEAEQAPTGQPAPPPEKPQKPYALSFGFEVDNILNHTNPGQPVGVLTSPEFGKSLSLNSTFVGSPNANRMIYLSTSFDF